MCVCTISISSEQEPNRGQISRIQTLSHKKKPGSIQVEPTIFEPCLKFETWLKFFDLGLDQLKQGCIINVI